MEYIGTYHLEYTVKKVAFPVGVFHARAEKNINYPFTANNDEEAVALAERHRVIIVRDYGLKDISRARLEKLVCVREVPRIAGSS